MLASAGIIMGKHFGPCCPARDLSLLLSEGLPFVFRSEVKPRVSLCIHHRVKAGTHSFKVSQCAYFCSFFLLFRFFLCVCVEGGGGGSGDRWG